MNQIRLHHSGIHLPSLSATFGSCDIQIQDKSLSTKRKSLQKKILNHAVYYLLLLLECNPPKRPWAYRCQSGAVHSMCLTVVLRHNPPSPISNLLLLYGGFLSYRFDGTRCQQRAVRDRFLEKYPCAHERTLRWRFIALTILRVPHVRTWILR